MNRHGGGAPPPDDEEHKSFTTRESAARGSLGNTLAVDIGGTKFSMAVFEGDRMVRRESRATDRTGGRDWMLERIVEIGRAWRADPGYERCGIGFGGPVLSPSSASRFPPTSAAGATRR